MGEIILIRHAQPVTKGVLLGSLDPELTAAGLEKAKEIKVPEGLPVYVSPMRRAVDTATAAGLTFTVVDNFREIDYGPWEGLSWKEVEQAYPEEAKLKLADWLGYTMPGSESWADFSARVLTSFETISKPCVIVAHLAVNSVLRHALTGRSPQDFMQTYCEIVKITQ